mmetsp:Transcript_35176/g.100472  ORF Transcript_35176/g.100472 Transcript_35176/m.100472 type:complete len:247 (+) Transcript_35176:694-1434(+)
MSWKVRRRRMKTSLRCFMQNCSSRRLTMQILCQSATRCKPDAACSRQRITRQVKSSRNSMKHTTISRQRGSSFERDVKSSRSCIRTRMKKSKNLAPSSTSWSRTSTERLKSSALSTASWSKKSMQRLKSLAPTSVIWSRITTGQLKSLVPSTAGSSKTSMRRSKRFTPSAASLTSSVKSSPCTVGSSNLPAATLRMIEMHHWRSYRSSAGGWRQKTMTSSSGVGSFQMSRTSGRGFRRRRRPRSSY